MRTLTDWEIQHGYIHRNHFYRPMCCILKNGEPLELYGIYEYPHYVAWQLAESEQPLTNATLTVAIYHYTPKPIAWYDEDTQQRITSLSDAQFSEVQA